MSIFSCLHRSFFRKENIYQVHPSEPEPVVLKMEENNSKSLNISEASVSIPRIDVIKQDNSSVFASWIAKIHESDIGNEFICRTYRYSIQEWVAHGNYGRVYRAVKKNLAQGFRAFLSEHV